MRIYIFNSLPWKLWKEWKPSSTTEQSVSRYQFTLTGNKIKRVDINVLCPRVNTILYYYFCRPHTYGKKFRIPPSFTPLFEYGHVTSRWFNALRSPLSLIRTHLLRQTLALIVVFSSPENRNRNNVFCRFILYKTKLFVIQRVQPHIAYEQF